MGYRNGDIMIWKRGQSAPSPAFAMSEHPNTPRRPIRKLYYTILEGKQFLCCFGGTSMSHEPDTLVPFYLTMK